MSEQKPREWWIEKFNGRSPASYYAHFEEPKRSMVRIKINDSEVPASEYFHVIEKSAYDALKAENERLKCALEYSRSQCHRGHGVEIDRILKGEE